MFFWAAISRENEGKSRLNWSKQSDREFAAEQTAKGREALLKAASYYASEAEIYEKAHAIFLAERARSNKEWCESLANEQLSQSSFLASK